MGIFSRKPGLNWIQLTTSEQLETALKATTTKPALFFKHSTRCSISTMAFSRFEANWNSDLVCDLYFLDLISYRDLSNLIAEKTRIVHQSPQVIVVNNGEVIYNDSHNGIRAQEIEALI